MAVTPELSGGHRAPGLNVQLARPLRAARGWLPRGRSLPVEEWAKRHHWLVVLLWLHAAALPVYGVWRGYGPWHALLEGGAIAIFAAAATMDAWPVRWRAALAAVGLVTASAVLVHFSEGLIEAHFHFFVVILLLTLYEDWIPFLIALGYVVIHHGVAGQLSPELVYNHPAAIDNPWEWALVHGGFVAAAAAGAVVAWRLNEDARAHAGHAVAQAVRSEEANAMKSTFIATTSHELRTPLTSIGGFATTLLHRWDELGDGDKLQMLQIIECQSSRLRRLIEDLLVLSAIERGTVPVRQSSVDVRAAVESVLADLAGAADVAVDLPPGLAVHADEQHVAQILSNLLANASKYGRPPVTIGATTADGWVELAVADRGPGVPEAFVPQLFETFTRADGVEGEGSGLGLSVVRGLAEANGGSVRYEPHPSRGACFRVRLPRVPA